MSNAYSIANCAKCQKVFQRLNSPFCQDCLQTTHETFTQLYRVLQQSGARGGISADELARETGISAAEIEAMYHSGRLGTAGIFLKLPCSICRNVVGEMERKGRFCNKCSEKLAKEAKVEVRTIQSIAKEEKEETKRQEMIAALEEQQKKRQPVPDSGKERRFGLTSRTNR
jgi:predicted amidophosphoribosyltransferase